MASSRPALRRLATAIVCVLCFPVERTRAAGPRGGQGKLFSHAEFSIGVKQYFKSNLIDTHVNFSSNFKKRILTLFTVQCNLDYFIELKLTRRWLEKNADLTNR